MNIVNNLRLINKVCLFCHKIIFDRQNKRFIHLSKCSSLYHEPENKIEDKTPLMEHFRNGLFMLKDEVKIWKNEVIETIELDPYVIMPGAIDKVFTFESVEKLDQWVVTSDSDHDNGYSTSELTINEHGKAVFQGVLNTEMPADGKLSKTGYCNMRSVRPKKSFQRDSYHDWSQYTYLVFRVRGDGRPFIINLATPGYYDLMWNDVFQYVLHTRGGPYWQTTKIPFSKFFLSHKGKIQDLQYSIPLDDITNVGLTMADKTSGPFKLEIDYIGVEYDPDYTEEFAYEMYKLPRNLANS